MPQYVKNDKSGEVGIVVGLDQDGIADVKMPDGYIAYYDITYLEIITEQEFFKEKLKAT